MALATVMAMMLTLLPPITTPLNVLGNSFSFIGGEGTGDILGPITGIIGGIGGDGDIQVQLLALSVVLMVMEIF